MRYIRMIVTAWLLPVCLLLLGCEADQQSADAGSGSASITISINTGGSLRPSKAARVAGKLAGIPDEITQIDISITDTSGQVIAAGDLVASNGALTLQVPAGEPLTITGAARASNELLFAGNTEISALRPNERRSVGLRLNEQVSVNVTAPAAITAIDTPLQMQASINGLNDSTLRWYVNGVAGGSAEFGFIDANGLYTPPSVLPVNPVVVIRGEPVAAPSFAEETSITLNGSVRYTVRTSAGAGGSISPVSVSVASGATVSFTVTPNPGYSIAEVTGCNGALTSNRYTTGAITANCTVSASFTVVSSYTVSATAGAGGSISPASASVASGATTSFTVTPDAGYSIAGVTGCNGALSGNTYTTGSITADCTVSASFTINSYTVSATAGAGGSISPSSATVNYGANTSFTVTPDSGYSIAEVTGCNGTLSGNTYTTGAIAADCTVTASFTIDAAQPVLGYQAVKKFRFTWTDIPGATHYRLLEDPDGNSGYTQVSADIPQGTQIYDHTVTLYRRINARYILQTCTLASCVDATPVSVDVPSMVGAIGVLQASNTEAGDYFGRAVALSDDGKTLAVGARYEDSAAAGIDGNQADNTKTDAGAVYVFTADATGAWSQQAYLKASNSDTNDRFGWSVALSADGNTLAVGAPWEDSSATGVNGDQANNNAFNTGAAYVFTRSGVAWTQQAYVKAHNTQASGFLGAIDFGWSVDLSADGNTLAVGSIGEFTTPGSSRPSGAVYVFTRDASAVWSQQAFIKAPNVQAFDEFGHVVALSADGNTLAASAVGEDSAATGIDGNQADNNASKSGAVYVYTRDAGGVWSLEAYIKASNTGAGDEFGQSLALSADGSTLAAGAHLEYSAATGINGDQADNTVAYRGAVYIFTRDASNVWSQQAYIKASYPPVVVGGVGPDSDQFGFSVSLSADGNTLVVGANTESSSATGLNGNQADNSGNQSGAAYVFIRDTAGNWSQQAYVKASDVSSSFSYSAVLNADGSTLVLGSSIEQVYLY